MGEKKTATLGGLQGMFSEEGQISTGAGREGLCREVGGTGDFAVAQ